MARRIVGAERAARANRGRGRYSAEERGGRAVSGTYETFEVVEVSERHGFARVRSERTGQVLHTELVPEGQPEKLRVGDRVRGLQRGQGVSRVTWIAEEADGSLLERFAAAMAPQLDPGAAAGGAGAGVDGPGAAPDGPVSKAERWAPGPRPC